MRESNKFKANQKIPFGIEKRTQKSLLNSNLVSKKITNRNIPTGEAPNNYHLQNFINNTKGAFANNYGNTGRCNTSNQVDFMGGSHRTMDIRRQNINLKDRFHKSKNLGMNMTGKIKI